MPQNKRNRRRKKKAFADNCGACGNEHMSTELTKVVLRNWDLKLCKSCLDNDTLTDYQSAVGMINKQSTEDKYREAAKIIKKRSS